ncbi:hypothetical protein Tco_0938914 [Tanacetum coccineum]|uniref:Reverse transcriptase domain-containing protein n=1 Tax=Tanacetum coccineum TaxID=301880 RepID=A0ABQ5DJ95_9ASTR
MSSFSLSFVGVVCSHTNGCVCFCERFTAFNLALQSLKSIWPYEIGLGGCGIANLELCCWERFAFSGKDWGELLSMEEVEAKNRSVTYPRGIAEDVIVKVDKFNFLADFVIVDFEADHRVPITLGRLRTAKALIDFYEKSSGSTTSHSDHSLLDYEAFYFDVDHIKEKSSGSTTSHSDLSLLEYVSFHFDFLIDPPPIAKRSDSHHEEFIDGLAHIISPPEYDHFYFDLEADPGELTRVLKKDISETLTKDLIIHELNDFPLLLSDCDSIFSKEFPEINLIVLFPSRNKDKIFDPEIFIIKGVQS